MLNKRMPTGIESFAELINGNFAFVDKTLLIKAVIDTPNQVLLLTRPCGWGKTLNLSMLQHFFSEKVAEDSTQNVFKHCNITTVDNGAYQAYQGKHPVIGISFKGINHGFYRRFKTGFRHMIRTLYQTHSLLLDLGQLTDTEKVSFKRFRDKNVYEAGLKLALRHLSKLLYKVHKQKVVLLIDDYDIPLRAGACQGNNQKKIAMFMNDVLSALLLNNDYFSKIVIMGTANLAELKLFAQLPTLKECSLLDEAYHEYFGFTDAEVDALAIDLPVSADLSAIKAYYKGYQAGAFTLYTPSSIVNCLLNQGAIGPYWVSSSYSPLIEQSILYSVPEVKQCLLRLLQGEIIEVLITRAITHSKLEKDASTAWSLLLQHGYITIDKAERDPPAAGFYYIRIPNGEVRCIYMDRIKETAFLALGQPYQELLVDFFLSGNLETAQKKLQTVWQSLMEHVKCKLISALPRKNAHVEHAYYLLALKLAVDLYQAYAVQVDYPDELGGNFMLVSQRAEQGIIVKWLPLHWERNVKTQYNQTEHHFIAEALEKQSQTALAALKFHPYIETLKKIDIRQIQLIGIAVEGKQLQMCYERIVPSAEHAHAESADVSNQDVHNVENPHPAFVQRLFGGAITVIRQVKGMFDGETKTFNVYQTQQRGQGGFNDWPVPYSRAEAAALLLQNSHSAQVRELLAPEIISVFNTGRLPKMMRDQCIEFDRAYQQMKIENNGKEDLFNNALHKLKLGKTMYSAKNFEELVRYLTNLPTRKANEHKQLLALQNFQLNEQIQFLWFKRFCTEERVFSLFVQTYLAEDGISATATPLILGSAILDTILEVISPAILLCIWELLPQDNQVHCRYLGGRLGAPVTHVLRNPDETPYFELMADVQNPLKLTQLPLQSDSGPLKRTPTQYNPMLFGSASKRRISHKNKERDVSEEPKKDETNRFKISFILN